MDQQYFYCPEIKNTCNIVFRTPTENEYWGRVHSQHPHLCPVLFKAPELPSIPQQSHQKMQFNACLVIFARKLKWFLLHNHIIVRVFKVKLGHVKGHLLLSGFLQLLPMQYTRILAENGSGKWLPAIPSVSPKMVVSFKMPPQLWHSPSCHPYNLLAQHEIETVLIFEGILQASGE